MSFSGRINKLLYSHMMGYYLVIQAQTIDKGTPTMSCVKCHLIHKGIMPQAKY